MSKLLVIFGATGQQGGSIANYVLNDPVLSKQYKVRGVTRDPSKPAAQSLQQKGAEVVKGDADDAESLKSALNGAHTVYAITVTILDSDDKTQEVVQGKAITDAAIAAGAQYFIFSTLPRVSKITQGKITTVENFDLKAQVEEYIRRQPIKSAFFAPGYFMQNFATLMVPQPVGDGSFALSNIASPATTLPLIDIAADAGKFVGAILADPEKFESKTVAGAVQVTSLEEIAKEISYVSGKNVTYNQIPERIIRDFLPPTAADMLVGMFIYYQDFGYFGSQTKEVVEEATQTIRGEVTSLADFLSKNPLPTLNQ